MEWFLLRSGKVEGPMSGEELLAQLQAGRVNDSDLACKKGSTHWSPVAVIEEAIRAELKNLKEGPVDIKPWVLLIEKADDPQVSGQESPYTQRGPFGTEEIVTLIQTGEARYSDYVWKSGFERWVRINEIDEFFKHHPTTATPEDLIPPQMALPKNEKKAEIYQQAKAVSALDFVENVDEPGLDEAALKPLVIESPQQETQKPQSPEAPLPFEFKVDLNAEKLETEEPNFLLNEKKPSLKKIDELDSEENTHNKKTLSDMNLLPWVLGTLTAAMVGLVTVWYFQREKIPLQPPPISDHSVPASTPKAPEKKNEAPAKEITRWQPRTDIPAIQNNSKGPSIATTKAQPTNFNDHAKIVSTKREIKKDPKRDRRHLILAAKILEKKAENLDQKYRSLKDSPLSWRRFYSQWQKELDSSALEMPESKKGNKFIKSFRTEKNRLLERGAMMDRSVVKAIPVSSDFQRENLADSFRQLAKKIRQ